MSNRHERRLRRAQAEQKHHWIVAAELVYKTADDRTVTTKLNLVHTTADKLIRAADLGRIQQNLQLHFHGRANNPELVVLDICVLAVNHLGLMSNDDFSGTSEDVVVSPETVN